MPISATVDVSTRVGDQQVALTGWMELQKAAPRLEDGRVVTDVQLSRLRLAGASQLGAVAVSERDEGTHVSRGEVRGLLSGTQFPASSFLDVYAEISAPDSPAGPLLLHNDDALHLVPWQGAAEASLAGWPPLGVEYRKAGPGGCVELLDENGLAHELGLCVRDLRLDIAPATPTFSVGRGGPSRLHPADLLGLSPASPDAAGQPPFVRIGCAALGLSADGCDDGSDGTQDNIAALSFGQDLGGMGPPREQFSVTAGALGAPGSAIEQQHNCPPADPGLAPEAESDIFTSTLDGTNEIVFDGNGPIGSCTPAFPLGLVEAPSARDSVDALDMRDAATVEADADGVPERAVYFSLDADSPSLSALGFSPGDVLATVAGDAPTQFASASQLDLRAGDEIANLCLEESGDGAYGAGDVVYFALTPRSPSLAAVGAGPGDLLRPGAPLAVVARGSSLGLAGTDALGALSCESPLPAAGANGDVNCDGAVNEIDVQLVLQYEAGLIPALPCPQGDTNGDGAVDSVDALLILQLHAGLIGRLPQ